MRQINTSAQFHIMESLEEFFDQLPRVPESELPKDSSCMVCRRDYGTDSADIAVMLPCNHHVGLECISTWLLIPGKNTCPMCRHVFFDVVDHGDMEEYRREVVRRVGRGHLPQEGHAQVPTWYESFVEAAAEQYQDSLTRAREFLLRISSGRWNPIHGELEAHVAKRATAFRTLAVREVMLYLELEVLPPLMSPITRPLNAEQLEALFQELRRRDAFNHHLQPFEPYVGRNDRQKWLLHREEGECYTTEEGGFWSLALG